MLPVQNYNTPHIHPLDQITASEQRPSMPHSRLTSLCESMRSANDHRYSQLFQTTPSDSLVPRIEDVVIAVSSGALFDFSADHQIEQTQGPQAYADYQIANEANILSPGDAFGLVKKMYYVNTELQKINSPRRFDVVITSKNTPDACVRALNSAKHYNIPVERAAFTQGASPFEYAKAFGASLYLTTNAEDAKAALAEGVPAAHILPSEKKDNGISQLRVAFDADAVIFSDEAERISMTHGLEKFYDHERSNAHNPLEKGPLYPFLHQLSQIRNEFSNKNSPIRIAVTTARSAPAAERLIRTLRSWDIKVDELHLLGGKNKGPVLNAFKSDLFLDDKMKNVTQGAEYVPSAHVFYGVSNESQTTVRLPRQDVYKPAKIHP